MKRILIILLCGLALSSCNPNKAKHLDDVDSLRIVRFDRVEGRYVTTGDFSALQEMNLNYPTQTRTLIEDMLQLGTVEDLNINRRVLEFFQDSTLQSIVHAAESQYSDVSDIELTLHKAFRNLRKQFPNCPIPTIYAQIGALDHSIIVDNETIGVSLDMYLGSDFPAYERFFTDWQRETMTREFIAADVLVFYLLGNYGLRDFDRTSEEGRDVFIGVIMYAVNELLEKRLIVSPYVERVEQYAKDNKLSIKELLEKTDYTDIWK